MKLLTACRRPLLQSLVVQQKQQVRSYCCPFFLSYRSIVSGLDVFVGTKKNSAVLAHAHNNHHQGQQQRFRSNRSRRGLYDGKDIRSGNNVSFSMKATKRKFKPNVFLKRVYSETLDEMIRFHLTAATLRSIDHAGGLDHYLLKNDFTEGEGYVTKKRILQKMKEDEKSSNSGTVNSD